MAETCTYGVSAFKPVAVKICTFSRKILHFPAWRPEIEGRNEKMYHNRASSGFKLPASGFPASVFGTGFAKIILSCNSLKHLY